MLTRLRHQRSKMVSVSVLHDGTPEIDDRGTSLPIITIESSREKTTRQMRGRIILTAAVFGLVFSALFFRLANVTMGGFAPDPSTRVVAFQPERELLKDRAEILDRNGNRLAMNAVTIGAAIESRNVWNAHETAAGIVSVFPDMDIDTLEQRIKNKSYVFIKNDLAPTEREELLRLGLPGVLFTQGSKRVYPQGDLAAHVVGQIIPGKGGVMGLEGAIDRLDLTDTVYSTIDLSAQQILEEELAAAMEVYSAISAWGVVMDAKNGEVVALASLPDFNPNMPGDAPDAARRNRVMYDRYELGSAFKPITAAAALQDGVAHLDMMYDARFKLQIEDRLISDFTPKNKILTFMEVLQYSSNIGAAQMAQALGIERQKFYLKELGLLGTLETELPERRPSEWPQRWGPVESATIAYGHGIAVTPLQLTAAFAAVVNGGTYMTPTFLKQDKEPDTSHRVFSMDTSAAMRIALRRVVTDGTSKGAEASGYYPIGKTATADKPSRTGGYQENNRISSFIGAFPGYDPRFVILISLDEPKPTADTFGYATAGYVAAPVFQNVVSRLGPVFGLNPVDDAHAFAGFMREFETSKETQLALNEAAFSSVDISNDPVGSLLLELGP